MTNRAASTAVLVACVFAVSVRADRSAARTPDEETIVKLEHQWVDAALKGDAKTFESLMSADYQALLTGAQIRGKEAWAAGIRAGTTTYRSVDIRNLDVRMYGATAVVFGDYSQVATAGGRDNSASGTYMDIWVKRNGRWQVVASSFSRKAAV